MKFKKREMRLKILDLVPQADVILVGGQLITGDVYGENCFICVETGSKWELVGIGLISSEIRKKKFRLFEIRHIEGSQELEEGFTLISD